MTALPKRQQAPISQELRELKKEVRWLRRDQKNIGKAVRSIHGNTVPPIDWIPALAVAFGLVYFAQPLILDTARDYKISAWASGLLKDAAQATAQLGLNWGIRFAGGSTSFASPLQGALVVTSNFNPARKHPVTGEITAHNGTDYRCKVGDPVYAMRSGIIEHAKYTGNAGNMIIISHSNGDNSVYMHLDEMEVGYMEKVSTGELIGTCGATGRVTGPHLHVEIRVPDKDNPNGKPIDPVTVIGITDAADMWEYFKDTVAVSESQGSGDYQAISPSGTFFGRYQMSRPALDHAGYSHVSKEDFLASPKMQDAIYRAWQAKNLAIGKNGFKGEAVINGKRQYVDLKGFINSDTPAYRVAGFLHAAQFGAVNALLWYTKAQEFQDGNDTAISDYAERGESAFKAKYGRFAPSHLLIKGIEGDHFVSVPPLPVAQSSPTQLIIDVSKQQLRLVRNGQALKEYPVSTALNGIGNTIGSNGTPLGRHRIAQKIGDGAALGAIFKARQNTGQIAKIITQPVDIPDDLVTTRILWLDGLELGKNKGGTVDSYSRAIYIHGTPEEGLIGRPASHGCIRMKNRDVVELYEQVNIDTEVEIIS